VVHGGIRRECTTLGLQSKDDKKWTFHRAISDGESELAWDSCIVRPLGGTCDGCDSWPTFSCFLLLKQQAKIGVGEYRG
jgi:hypothetical protein